MFRRISGTSLAAFLISFFCLASTALAAPPQRLLAVYDVYKGGLKVGQIEERYERTQDRYTLTSTTTPLGLLAMFRPEKVFVRSEGHIGPQGLQPERFSHRRERDGGKDSTAEFDWATRQLTLVHHAQRDTLALPDGTQDRLSAMYQFMFLSLDSGTALDFPMTNGSKLDDYHYNISRGERLKTSAGTFDTLYLDSQAKAGETRTEIWLAKRQHNLPCKMVVTDADGDQLTQLLSRLTVSP